MILHAQIPAPFELRVADHETYRFNDTVPAGFQVGKQGRLSIDQTLYKAGAGSLRWDWTGPDGALTFANDEAFQHLTGQDPDRIVYEWITNTSLSTFSIWVFNEEATDDLLWFEIGDGTTVDSRFWMRLNFSGWRLCQAQYGRDIGPLGGFPGPTANQLRIIPPKSRASGTLWLDEFTPRHERDVRMVRTNAQLPWVRPEKPILRNDDFVKGRWTEDEIQERPRLEITAPEELTAEQTAAIARIRGEFMPWQSPPKPRALTEQRMEKLRELHQKHGFLRSGDLISGEIGTPKRYWADAGQIATAYWYSAEQPDMQAELGRMFDDFVDLFISQGHGAGYSLRTAFAEPAWLMREPLKKSGRWPAFLDRLRRAVSVHGFYDPEARADADVYNTVLRARLFAVLLEDDDRQVWSDLTALRHWLTRTARYGEIRPDGSFFHHNQTYSGYNLPAIGPWVDTVYLLRHTEFQSPVSHLYAYRTVYAMHWYSCITDMPHTLGGRWRTGGQFTWRLAQACRQLAEMGHPEEPGDTFDEQMAGIYLYYAAHYGEENEWTRRYTAMGLQPAKTDGHLSLNYTVAAIHRRDDWMVFFRGQRSPFFSGEAYASQAGNTMGRYINYGHMAIMSGGDPTTSTDSGWAPQKGTMAGWNWNFWPGTTTRELPFAALRCQWPIEEWVTSETFAVGTSLHGNGVFGLKIREDEYNEIDPTRLGPVKYWLGEREYERRFKAAMIDTAFRARKSVFCFDDQIICLGSGIMASDDEHRTVTTLLQHHLSPETRSRFHLPAGDGVAVPFPLSTRIEGNQPTWFIDSNGDGYILPAGHSPLVIERRLQALPYHTHTHETNEELNSRIDANEGETELVFLDHGKAPRNAGYAYSIVMQADADKVAALATTPTHRVLQRDTAAHVVYDLSSKTTGYVLFEPQRADLGGGDGWAPIVGVDRPCVLMAKPEDGGQLSVSVADPELGLPDGEVNRGLPAHSLGTWLHVVVRGQWELVSPDEQVQVARRDESTTVLRINCRELRPVEFTLSPIHTRK